MSEDARDAFGIAGVVAAIVVVFIATYGALRFAAVLKSVLGTSGLALIERLMGLIVAARAVQLIVHGVQALLA